MFYKVRKIVYFVFLMCFWVKNFFLKKNWIVLETSITILLMCTTDVYPFSPNLAPVFSLHLLILICVHLFLPVRISSYLSEFIFICQNLLLCLEISSCLWNLWEPFLFLENLWEPFPFRENLFFVRTFSWESLPWEPILYSFFENKQAYEHHHAK